MKIWTSEHVFNHSWETLTASQWQKYPNPHNTSVLRTDVVERKVDPQTGILESHRIITSDWALAPWVQRLIGANRECYAHEYSTVDPVNKIMKMDSVNLTFCNFVNMHEKMSYRPHPQDPEKTLLKQETVVTVKGVPLTSYMESIIVSSVNANAGKGRKAMEWVVDKVTEESQMISEKVDNLKLEIGNLKSTLIPSDLIHSAKKSIEELQSELKAIKLSTPKLQAQEEIEVRQR